MCAHVHRNTHTHTHTHSNTHIHTIVDLGQKWFNYISLATQFICKPFTSPAQAMYVPAKPNIWSAASRVWSRISMTRTVASHGLNRRPTSIPIAIIFYPSPPYSFCPKSVSPIRLPLSTCHLSYTVCRHLQNVVYLYFEHYLRDAPTSNTHYTNPGVFIWQCECDRWCWEESVWPRRPTGAVPPLVLPKPPHPHREKEMNIGSHHMFLPTRMMY